MTTSIVQSFKEWLLSKTVFPFVVIGLLIGLYFWRVMSVHTYYYLLAQQEYMKTHSAPMVSDDSALEFIPYDNFDGPRKGMVFRYGSKGVGYYEDKGFATSAIQYAIEGSIERV